MSTHTVTQASLTTIAEQIADNTLDALARACACPACAHSASCAREATP